MGKYRIVSTANGYQVVETYPGGVRSAAHLFSTEDDARVWLDTFKILIGLLECMAGQSVSVHDDVPEWYLLAC